MTITKTAMAKLFADLNPEDTGAMAAALADFAQADRPNSGHRLPEALAARFRDFAVECGVDESAVTVAEPSFGFCAVRFKGGADFFAALRAMDLATSLVQTALTVYGPAGLISECADAPETPAAAAPASSRPDPLVPAVAAALADAAKQFLDQIGPFARLDDNICTPESWNNWAEDHFDDPPDYPDNLDIGELTVCVQEMKNAHALRRVPDLSAIETALIYLDMAPELPKGLARVFYGLACSSYHSNCYPAFLGRYVADGETLPDFRLLLSDIPGRQYCVGMPANPLANYLSNAAAKLESLRDKGAVAFVGFGSAFLTRKSPEVLAFASDTKAFWDYVRELYTRWISLGDPDIGVALRDNSLTLVFHPFSRVGLRAVTRPGNYADVSEDGAVDNSLVQYVSGTFDSDMRSGEDDYTGFDEEDEQDRDRRFEEESDIFRSTAAAAVYGFAVVPGTSNIADGIEGRAPAYHVVCRRPEPAQLEEDVDGDDTRLGVGDLPLEWSALIHGIDVHTTSELRDFYSGNWSPATCWPVDSAGFPVHVLSREHSSLGQPNMSEFLGEMLHAFRTMANNACVTVPEDDRTYTVPEAHNRSKYVTAVYTGMTVSTSPMFDIGETPETFSVPSELFSDNALRQERQVSPSADPETITDWLEHLSAHPEVQLKCAKRMTGDTSPRMAWTIIETNLPFDQVQRQCNELHLGESTRCTRDVLRVLFADAVIRGQSSLFNRFFRTSPLPGNANDDARLVDAVAEASRCQIPGTATRVFASQVPELFTRGGASSSWAFPASELRQHVKVSFAADMFNRLVVVIAVDGKTANVARLRYRAACPDNPRFGVLTASMARAYRAALDNPDSPFDIYVAPGTTWQIARPRVFHVVAGAARYGNVIVMDPPCGGLTTLMLAPRGEYNSDLPYPRSDYAPAPGVRVVNGGVEDLRGFRNNTPF